MSAADELVGYLRATLDSTARVHPEWLGGPASTPEFTNAVHERGNRKGVREIVPMDDVVTCSVLAAILAVAGTAPSASPAVSPSSAAEKPLPVIGRVRVTTPLCKTLLGDASVAVQIEAENDRRLGTAVATLKAEDLDSSALAKQHGIHELTRQFVTLRAAAVAGNDAMHSFRGLTKEEPSADQRAKLGAFADALDGALRRQRLLADRLGGLIAYLDAHEPMTKEEHDKATFDVIASENDSRLSARSAFDARDFGLTAAVPDQLSTVAKASAADIETRSLPLNRDEDDASAKIEPAFSGC